MFKRVFSVVIIVILVLVVVILMSNNRSGLKTYYVDSIGGNDANDGISAKTAWQSLTIVNQKNFLPGEVVKFKKGSEWNSGLVIEESGIEGEPITFTSYGDGEKPVISNTGQRSNAITINGSWIVVEDFFVREASYAGVQIEKGAANNIVRNCEATDVGIGFAVSGQHNLISHNYAHNLKIIRNTPGGDDDYGAVGVWLFNSNNEVCYNRMVDCKAPCYDYGFDGGAVEWYGTVDSCYVHHNWATGCVGFFEIGGGSAKQTLIAYNVSINNLGVCWIHLSGKFGSTVENLRFENNTVIEIGEDNDRVIGFGADPQPGTFIMRNNIVYTNKKIANRQGYTHENNLYYLSNGAQSDFALGKGEIYADPEFVDFEQKDFHLKAGSPAIDAGINLEHRIDFDGNQLPVGQSPDLGAFEYK